MRSKGKTVTAPNRAVTLDRAHLTRYTMENRELEREIIALFLQQLPTTSAMLNTAESETDWKLAVHTLKGSAAAIGALHINALASELEEHGFGQNREAVQGLLVALDLAFAEFRRAVGRIPK